LQELEEIQNDTYENARIYKEKTKSLHDRMITRKEFHVGDKVLYHSASVELAEPIYEAWACDVLSQWHKTKVLTRRQPNLQKKNSELLSFSFIFYFSHFNLCLSFSSTPFSFISTLRTMLYLSVRVRILVFFVVSLCFIWKKPINIWKQMFSNLSIKFYLLNSHW